MNLYFAPLEGLTGYVYRNAHHAFFGSMDKYFSPFIVPNQTGKLRSKELRDILPENNQGMLLVPQLLTNNARDFIQSAGFLKQLGYQEINLNLGCPSATVVSKNKGAGFLAKREALDAFLEEIFSSSVLDISIKTRIGKQLPEEFYELIEIYNKYPMKELIIHPRTRDDFYNNLPNRKVFADALKLSKNTVCYNGDIRSVSDYQALTQEFPALDRVMLGRGLLAYPGLADEIKGGKKTDRETWKAFHDRLYGDYKEVLSGDRNVLFKMKELWQYMLPMLTEDQGYMKKIKKAERLYDYEQAVYGLFASKADG